MCRQSHCGGRTLVVKAHPDITPYNLLRQHAGGSNVYFHARNMSDRDKLAQGCLPWWGGTTLWDGTQEHTRRRFDNYFKKCHNQTDSQVIAGEKRWRPRRALIIDRDPYAAMWSEYQREFQSGSNGGHSAAIGADELDVQHWELRALEKASDYLAAWAGYEAWLEHVPGGKATT